MSLRDDDADESGGEGAKDVDATARGVSGVAGLLCVSVYSTHRSMPSLVDEEAARWTLASPKFVCSKLRLANPLDGCRAQAALGCGRRGGASRGRRRAALGWERERRRKAVGLAARSVRMREEVDERQVAERHSLCASWHGRSCRVEGKM